MVTKKFEDVDGEPLSPKEAAAMDLRRHHDSDPRKCDDPEFRLIERDTADVIVCGNCPTDDPAIVWHEDDGLV